MFSGFLPNQSADRSFVRRTQEVRAGIDIVQAKRSAREETKAVEIAAAAPTFQQCAERYIDDWSKWSEKHQSQWASSASSLKRHAYPTIGQLTPIWIEKRETSNRVRGRIETIIARNVDIDDHELIPLPVMLSSMRAFAIGDKK